MRQIAESTRIGMYYLRAIEGGSIHKLPPGIYARSYVRQYARAIDFDEAELLRHFDLTAEIEEFTETPRATWVSRLFQLLPILNSRTESSR